MLASRQEVQMKRLPLLLHRSMRELSGETIASVAAWKREGTFCEEGYIFFICITLSQFVDRGAARAGHSLAASRHTSAKSYKGEAIHGRCAEMVPTSFIL